MNALAMPATPGRPGYDAAALAVWSGGQWEPRPPAAVAGVSNDSRSLPAGAVYLALTGERCDGHAFTAAAQARGAAGAVVRADWARTVPADFPLLRVPSPDAALPKLAAGYRQQLAPHCIGITGSAGKTTVKELTASALATTFATARTRGNWNNQIGLPLSLLSMDAQTRVGIFEIGTNHPGEIACLAALLQPRWGIVTNVGAGHIEHFGAVAAIAAEKADVLRALPRDGLAFLNRDGAWFDYLRAATVATVVTVSTRGDADYCLAARSDANDAVDAVAAASGTHFRFALRTGGECQAANALFAIAVADRMGVPAEAIAASLSATPALPMRWERLEVGGARVVNDAYNANPLSMRAALESFRAEPGPERRWLVLGAMLELGAVAEAEHRALGRAVAAEAWTGLIVVGKPGEWIAAGAEEAGYPPARIARCADTASAAQVLDGSVRAGDGVLLKASRGARLEEVLAHWRGLREATAG